jgi:hypothetical protein
MSPHRLGRARDPACRISRGWRQTWTNETRTESAAPRLTQAGPSVWAWRSCKVRTRRAENGDVERFLDAPARLEVLPQHAVTDG